MSEKSREIIPTSFNLKDEFELGLYDHVKSQGIASKYIKRLIFMDKERFTTNHQNVVTPINKEQEEALTNISI